MPLACGKTCSLTCCRSLPFTNYKTTYYNGMNINLVFMLNKNCWWNNLDSTSITFLKHPMSYFHWRVSYHIKLYVLKVLKDAVHIILNDNQSDIYVKKTFTFLQRCCYNHFWYFKQCNANSIEWCKLLFSSLFPDWDKPLSQLLDKNMTK